MIPGLGRSTGEGIGFPLQCSCIIGGMLIVCISGSSVLNIFTDIIFFKSHNSLVRLALFFLRFREVQELSLHFIARRGRAGIHTLGCTSSGSPSQSLPEDMGADLPILAGSTWCLGTPGEEESGPGGGKTSRIGVSVRELWFRVAPQAGSESRKPAGSLGED